MNRRGGINANSDVRRTRVVTEHSTIALLQLTINYAHLFLTTASRLDKNFKLLHSSHIVRCP